MFVTIGDGGATTTGIGTGSIGSTIGGKYFVTASTVSPYSAGAFMTQYQTTLKNLTNAINSSSIHGLNLTATASLHADGGAVVLSGSSAGTSGR